MVLNKVEAQQTIIDQQATEILALKQQAISHNTLLAQIVEKLNKFPD